MASQSSWCVKYAVETEPQVFTPRFALSPAQTVGNSWTINFVQNYNVAWTPLSTDHNVHKECVG